MAGVDWSSGDSGPNDAPPGYTGSTQHPSQSGINPWLGVLTVLGTALGGNYLRQRSADSAVPPELRQLLAQSVDRQAFQNPLVEANTRGTFSMLPNFATQGLSLKGSLSQAPPKVPTSADSGGGDNPLTSMNPLRNPLLAGALGALLGGGIPGMGGSGNIGKLISDIANAFRHGNSANPFGGPTTYTGHDPFGSNLPGYNEGDWNNPDVWGNGWGGLPTDPSGGSGTGPGMQDYYNNGGNSGGAGSYGGNDYSYLPGYGTDPSGSYLPGGDNSPGGGDWGEGGGWFTHE